MSRETSHLLLSMQFSTSHERRRCLPYIPMLTISRFNTYADAVATARVFALTSPNPASTMPPPPPNMSTLPAYPSKLSRQLNLTLFPLDITTPHLLRKSTFDATLAPLAAAGSPLAEWTTAFVHKTYEKMQSLSSAQEDPGYDSFFSNKSSI